MDDIRYLVFKENLKIMKLSAVLIVRNEENTIKRCLESIKDYVDEIIVVDTGSTDNTILLSKDYTDKVFSFEWTDDFSEARNFGIENASSEYILSIDADEYLDNSAKQVLEQIFKNQNKEYDAFFVEIVNFLDDGSTSNHWAVRVFKNTLRFSGTIHEEVISENILKLPLKIFHTGYLHEVVLSKAKSERNIRLLEKKITQTNQALDLFYLSKEYLAINQRDKGKELLIKSLSDKKIYNQVWVPMAWEVLLGILFVEKDKITIENILVDIIEIYPNLPEFYYYFALLKLENGDLIDSEKYFYKSLERLENSFSGETTLTENIYKWLWKIHFSYGEYEVGLTILEKLAEYYEINNNYYSNILVGVLKKNESYFYERLKKYSPNLKFKSTKSHILQEQKTFLQSTYSTKDIFTKTQFNEYLLWLQNENISINNLQMTSSERNFCFSEFEKKLNNMNHIEHQFDKESVLSFYLYPYRFRIGKPNYLIKDEYLNYEEKFIANICYGFKFELNQKDGFMVLNQIVYERIQSEFKYIK